MRRGRRPAPLYALIGTLILPVAADADTETLAAAIRERVKAQEAAQDSQQRIERLDDETRELRQQYQEVRAELGALRSYHDQFERLIGGQGRRLASVRRQLVGAEATRRDLIPLLAEMIDTLEEFIALDLPFLAQERGARIRELRALLDRPDVSLPEKYRRVMEAYRVEIEYGNRLEAGPGLVELAQRTVTVELLRVGRLALYYQTLDGKSCGRWDREQRRWQPLPARHNRDIAEALRIAKRQAPPDLLRLPLPAIREIPEDAPGGAPESAPESAPSGAPGGTGDQSGDQS
ncbi:MAG: DUF3450 domain-containing protein [Gammaproteobacteria bacterium]|nr:DUF3450 domain-containing protein [Gammaproteobacteria bacterium]